MGCFSPTVRNEAFDLGGILDQLAGNYFGGRQQKEDRRRVVRQERREDEADNRYLRGLRAADLAEPGARNLAEYLGDPQAAQITQESLAQIGNAAEPNAPIAFERPAPTQVELPDGSFITAQERAPHVTASGIVMDPQAARREQTLSTVLDEQLRRSFDKPAETAEERAARLEADERARVSGRRLTPEQRGEDVAHAGDLADARRAPGKPREVAPPTLSAALSAIKELYGTWDPDIGDYTYPFDPDQRREIVGGLSGVEFPTVEGPTPDPVPPPETPEASIGFWDSFRNKFVRGQPYPKDTAATPPDSASAPAAPASPAVSTDLTAAQTQEMAAKEWEALVDAGTDPDEATRLLREKYGLPGEQ